MPSSVTTLLHNRERAGQGMLSSTPTPGTLTASQAPVSDCHHCSAEGQGRRPHRATFMHWKRKWQPTPMFLPGGSQGRGSLVGCRLWGRTELDTTEVT